MHSWQCLKSLQVPANVIKEGEQCLPTSSFSDTLPLIAIKYIDCNAECLVLSYYHAYSASKGGLLTLEDYDLKLWYDETLLKNNFQTFPSFIGDHLNDTYDIAVSDDQQFISIRSYYVSLY